VSFVVQPSLFGSLGELGVAELGAAVERRPLSDGAWIDVRPGFITAADELFDVLARVVPWHEERTPMYDRTVQIPRLLAGYSSGEALPHPVLDEARSALNAHYEEELGEPFVSAGLCLYRDGSDSVAFHGDRIARESARDTMVAIISLGATRPFGLRPKSGGPGLRLSIGHGDLLVMGGSCQRTWQHAIPKTANCLGARISVQFRPHWGNDLGKPPYTNGNRVFINIAFGSSVSCELALKAQAAGGFATRAYTLNSESSWDAALRAAINILTTDKVSNHSWAKVGDAPIVPAPVPGKCGG
jgi:alkylated DNA repair dioxygenase AlkB